MPLLEGLSGSWKYHSGLQCHLKACWDGRAGVGEAGLSASKLPHVVTDKTQSLATWPLHAWTCLTTSPSEPFRTQDRHNRTTGASPSARASFKGIWLGQSYRAPCLKGLYTWFNAPLYHPEILNNFKQKGLHFHSTLNPTHYVNKSCSLKVTFLLNVTAVRLELHFIRWGHLNWGQSGSF